MNDPGMLKTLSDLAIAHGATWADTTAEELWSENGLDYSDAPTVSGLQCADIGDTIFAVRFTQNVAGAIVHHVELYVFIPVDRDDYDKGGETIVRQYRIRGDEIVP